MSIMTVTANKAVTLCLGTILALTAANHASATPITYAFATGSATSSGVPVPLSFWGGGVSGMFTYPGTVGNILTNPNGAKEYRNTLKDLSGSVAGFSFSDPNGRTQVGNDVAISIFPSADFFQLLAERPLGQPTPPVNYDLTRFEVAGFTLVNVRLFWIEGVLGATDFLTNNDLPDVPPLFEGRLVLDFVPTGDLGCVAGSDGFCSTETFVFFDGLRVQAVPEPGALALFGGGLLGLGAIRRRRKAQA